MSQVNMINRCDSFRHATSDKTQLRLLAHLMAASLTIASNLKRGKVQRWYRSVCLVPAAERNKKHKKSVLHAAYNPIHLENCKHLNIT